MVSKQLLIFMNKEVDHTITKQHLDELKAHENYQSIKDCLKSIQPQNDENLTYDNVGHCFRTINDFESAVIWYKRGLEIDPSNEFAHLGIGIVYQLTEQYDKAVEHLQKASQNISLITAINSLGITYKRMGRFDEALKAYREGIANLVFIALANLRRKENFIIYPVEQEKRQWLEPVIELGIKFAKDDGMKEVLWPSGDTAIELIEKQTYGGDLWHDEDGKRMYLPNYFHAVAFMLKQELEYAVLVNNIGTIYGEAGKEDEAKQLYRESIAYTPKDIDYAPPQMALRELEN